MLATATDGGIFLPTDISMALSRIRLPYLHTLTLLNVRFMSSDPHTHATMPLFLNAHPSLVNVSIKFTQEIFLRLLNMWPSPLSMRQLKVGALPRLKRFGGPPEMLEAILGAKKEVKDRKRFVYTSDDPAGYVLYDFKE